MCSSRRQWSGEKGGREQAGGGGTNEVRIVPPRTRPKAHWSPKIRFDNLKHRARSEVRIYMIHMVCANLRYSYFPCF